MIDKVIEKVTQGDKPPSMKLDTCCVDAEFRLLARIMLTSQVRKHAKYFPCCRRYEVGADLTC
jgi:hypothetical protein